MAKRWTDLIANSPHLQHARSKAMNAAERADEAFRDILNRFPEYGDANKAVLWEQLYNGYKEYEELKGEKDGILDKSTD